MSVRLPTTKKNAKACHSVRMETLWIILHSTLQSILIVAAIGLNVVYFVQIKLQEKKVTTTELLKSIKSALAILSLVIYAPLEVYLTNTGTTFRLTCMMKDVLEQTTMGSFVGGLLAVAVVRLRAGMCTGNANVLISKESALITFFGCVFFPALMSAISAIVSTYVNCQFDGQKNSCSTHCQTIIIFRLVMTVCLDIVPVLTIFTIYVFLYRLTKKRVRKATASKALRGIRMSACSLISVIASTWFPYVTTKILIVLTEDKPILFTLNTVSIYSKITVFLLHPVAEGMFLEHQRSKIKTVFSKLFKQKVGPHPHVDLNDEREDIGKMSFKPTDTHTININRPHNDSKPTGNVSYGVEVRRRFPSAGPDELQLVKMVKKVPNISPENDFTIESDCPRPRINSWHCSSNSTSRKISPMATLKSRRRSQDPTNLVQPQFQNTSDVINVVSKFLSTSAESVFSLFQENDKPKVPSSQNPRLIKVRENSL